MPRDEELISRLSFLLLAGLCMMFSSGCQPAANEPPMVKRADRLKIEFLDEVNTNFEVPERLDSLTFVDTNGEQVRLSEYVGKKHVVLVFTQGFSGMLCPFCKTQTSRLVGNYSKFEDLDAEVLVVYPGTRDHLDQFIEAAKTEEANVDSVPFPILLDEDLAATKFFNIKSHFAHPSTFIITKDGDIKLAYVGEDLSADRPSIKAMLGVLEMAQLTNND